MLQVFIYVQEEGYVGKMQLSRLRPRSYMTSWSFERLLKYVKEECYWNEVDLKDITAISIRDPKQHWENCINRQGGEN